MPTETPHQLARKLKQIRTVGFGLSEKQMADALKITERDIRDFEAGKREPPLLVLWKYAQSVGVSTDILIDDRKEIRPNIKMSNRPMGF